LPPEVKRWLWTYTNNTQQQPPFYSHYIAQPALAGTTSEELGDFVGAKFY